ncbi:hypothetical protein FXB40_31955 [Bradyrhizobium rifense]|uniref:Uncharacterized protein n=1 Tax=Bradyrhizobium rifense TaxID=515499 RepID=A0A5D3K963_9BRAD|nr:hypothetical protein [Bradyrhizobium rifense]TYL90707.1 hypothetical protein FXB40_31955 [Bradyrhizobium rifense]
MAKSGEKRGKAAAKKTTKKTAKKRAKAAAPTHAVHNAVFRSLASRSNQHSAAPVCYQQLASAHRASHAKVAQAQG